MAVAASAHIMVITDDQIRTYERDGAVKKFAEINKQLQGGEAEKTELVEMRKAAEVQCEEMALKCSRSEHVAQNGVESMLQLFGLLGMPARVATLAPASPDGDTDEARHD